VGQIMVDAKTNIKADVDKLWGNYCYIVGAHKRTVPSVWLPFHQGRFCFNVRELLGRETSVEWLENGDCIVAGCMRLTVPDNEK
jgi:hypothetical protein